MSLVAPLIVSTILAAQEPPGPESPLTRIVKHLGEAHKVSDELTGVTDHLQKVKSSRRYLTCLSRVLKSLHDPYSVPGRAKELRDDLLLPLATSQGLQLEFLLPRIAAWLDIDTYKPPTPRSEPWSQGNLARAWEDVADPEVTGMKLLHALSNLMDAAHQAIEEGFYRYDEDDIQVLFDQQNDFAESWYQSHFPGREIDEADLKEENFRNGIYKKYLRRMDLAYLLKTANVLYRMTRPEFLDQLTPRLLRTKRTETLVEGFTGDIIAVVGKTPAQRVVLGGGRDSKYDAQAALIIDLGGSDTYHEAAVNHRNCLASVVLDLRGKDVYKSQGRGPVSAVLGVSILVDQRGDDQYISGRFGQSASTAGLTTLIDYEGDDTYTAEDYGQSYSLRGISLLYDLEGDDRYKAWAYAQGAAIGDGFSGLVDVEGDDEYFADEKWPDVYGNSGPNVFHGASQGYSTGLRGTPSPELPGGFAACLDLDGKDRFQAGNFSQGGGYYFGFGLLYDGGGDDENFGTRYSQGFGVHQAVGIRWDVAGNDKYHTRTVANCGSAWDEGVGFLIDEGGDDLYEAGGLSLGGAANTAVAILIDGGGKDRYQSPGGKDSQGGTGDSSYHKKQSVGLLLDLGGDEDHYSREGRGNNLSLHEPWHAFFLDLKDASLIDAANRLTAPKEDK